MLPRPDLTRNLIHLTRGDTEVAGFNTLLNILAEQQLKGSSGMIQGGYKCVCFSEAPLSAIAALMAGRLESDVRYQPIGISIQKEFVYKLGGRPVIYQHKDDYEKLPESLRYRHVYYDPCRTPKPVDFTWEREWRLRTEALKFTPADVTVILPTRYLADQLRAKHSEAVKQGATGMPEIMPWHFVVLEDLGFEVPFQQLSVQIKVSDTGQPHQSFAPFTSTAVTGSTAAPSVPETPKTG